MAVVHFVNQFVGVVKLGIEKADGCKCAVGGIVQISSFGIPWATVRGSILANHKVLVSVQVDVG